MSWISPDSQDMLGATAGLADQLEASALMAREVGGLPSPEGLESIVVLGMGGSGVAGEILQAIGKDQLSLPVALVGDYSLPSFVGPSSLVIAVSFSGQTEETLEAAGTAIERGARLLAVTSGGRLEEMAAGAKAPVFHTVPGIPQPRAGVGTTTAPLLVALERLGLLHGMSEAIAAAVEQLKIRRDEFLDGRGLALEIAQRLGRTVPLGARSHRYRSRRRSPVEDPGERERQGAQLLRRPARVVPQRDLRLRTERGRDPPDDDDRYAPQRFRASPGSASFRPRWRVCGRGRGLGGRGPGPMGAASSPSSSISSRSVTSSRCT